MNDKLAIGAALGAAALLGALAVAYSSAQGDKAPVAASPSEAAGSPPLPPARDSLTPKAMPSTSSFSKEQEADIRAIVRNYLIAHPEVLMEASQAYDAKQERARLDGARSNLAALTAPDHGFVAGANPAAAEVVVVELFDYHCGYCKKAVGLVRELTKSDPKVKVVFRELPILREESEYAAKAALAARAQGKYADLHFAMMGASGVLSKDRVDEIARSKGLDLNKLRADMESAAVKESIEETEEIARNLDIDGTPTFIIASLNGEFVELIAGFSAERVTTAIAAAKKAAKGRPPSVGQ
jgi:protein-disulfide isomerase